MNLSDLLGADLTGKMQQLGEVIAAEWAAEARSELRSSLRPYIQSIGIREVTPNSVVVSLPGPGAPPKAATIARMVELGMGPGGVGTQGSYDVRKFLLRAGTRKIHWGKNGPYVNVPFPMRGAKSNVPGPLEIERVGGRRALARARKLAPRINDPRTGKLLSRGGSLPAGMAGKLRAHHVSDALAGVKRNASSYNDGKMQTSGYIKWRRASWSNRDPQAWRSKGVVARHFAQRVRNRLDKLIAEVF